MGRSHTEKHVLEERWGVSRCALCEATIVLGERPAWRSINGEREPLCFLCACGPASDPRSLTGVRRLPQPTWRADPAWRAKAA